MQATTRRQISMLQQQTSYRQAQAFALVDTPKGFSKQAVRRQSLITQDFNRSKQEIDRAER